MYMSQMLSVGKAENGYVIECCVPFKKDKEKAGKEMCGCISGPSSKEKQYLAKTMDEVSELVEKLMPLLDAEYKNEDDFDSAFAEAAKAMEVEDGED